ncbi:hypothetical protein BDD43_1313 [Mucilaginibacter gracilis]|uniref:ABC-2 type transport system permease protein n=1 Tax=Mucilaginibacter gracilis TaxID=423350 RepID=A0A495IZA3_9SPHI|nr:hypothetical protein [Mucilaginibacter gracilis]RKR81169.1 hypothetical protein BDD43_1313 [Mucilaginibacter gracilis]
MIDKIFLWVIGLFNGVFERSGINTVQLNLILKTKLLIDERRPKGMFVGKRKTEQAAKVTTATSWGTILVTMLMGAFYGVLLFVFKAPMLGEAAYFLFFMVLMSLTLITDFTNVLIDVRDQYIIMPRPVNDRTVSMARILHITIYVMRLALLQGIPGMIMVGFIDGVAAVPLFFLQIIEATMFTIFMVNMVYMLLMRSVSPQRVKDIVSYFQIGFSIIIFAIFRMPRLFDMKSIADMTLLNHAWAWFLPPVWIAALNEALIHFARANYTVFAMATIGVIVPFLSIWIVARVLAPGFNRTLAIMASSDGNGVSVQPKGVKKVGFIDKIANRLAPDPIENAGFRITWKLAARTREFKMKVYPSFAYVPVYFVYIVLNFKGDSFADGYQQLKNSSSYIFLLYMCTFVLSLILQNIAQADKYKPAWVYYALPIEKPGKILAGMYKAIISLYFLPYYIILSAIAVAVWGPAILNDILLAFFLNQAYGIILALFLVKGLPFSRPVLAKRAGGKGFISLFILLFAAVLGFGHYLLARWEIVIWIAVPIAALANWLMFNYYRKQTWEDIEIGEME